MHQNSVHSLDDKRKKNRENTSRSKLHSLFVHLVNTQWSTEGTTHLHSQDRSSRQPNHNNKGRGSKGDNKQLPLKNTTIDASNVTPVQIQMFVDPCVTPKKEVGIAWAKPLQNSLKSVKPESGPATVAAGLAPLKQKEILQETRAPPTKELNKEWERNEGGRGGHRGRGGMRRGMGPMNSTRLAQSSSLYY